MYFWRIHIYRISSFTEGAGNWGEFVNKFGVDVKVAVCVALKKLDSHMTGKSYQKQSESATAYSPSEFKTKVTAAIAKVDKTGATVVTTPQELKTSLMGTGGDIKQVVTFWDTIKNIGNQPKNDASNKLAKDVIAEMRGYADDAANNGKGSHTTEYKTINRLGNNGSTFTLCADTGGTHEGTYTRPKHCDNETTGGGVTPGVDKPFLDD